MNNLTRLFEQSTAFERLTCSLAIWLGLTPADMGGMVTQDWLLADCYEGENAQDDAPSDTRRKLEEDVRSHFWHSDWCRPNIVFGWLDRQAAITEREHALNAVVWVDEPYNRGYGAHDIRELLAERDQWRDAATNAHEMWEKADSERAELEAENAELQRELARVEWPDGGDIDYERAWAKQVEAIKELSEENDALREWRACFEQASAERDGLRKQRDHWQRVAGKHAEELGKLRDQLKTQRNNFDAVSEARDIWRERYKEAAKHAPLTAADGKPIEVGDVLSGGDGRKWRVRNIVRGDSHPVKAEGAETRNEYDLRALKAGWLTHEPPDSWERIANDLRAINGDTYAHSGTADLEPIAERVEKLAGDAR